MLHRLALVIALLGVLSLMVAAQTTANPLRRTISVTGKAERRVSPDLGIVVLAIQTQGSALTRVTQQNNATTNAVMNAVRKLAIPNLALRTLVFDVQPVYEQGTPEHPAPNPPKIIGYQVTNRLEVRIPDAETARLSDNAGRVLEVALEAGANRVDSITFTLQDERPVLRAVLADATRDAASTAAALASAAGVTLGPLMTLNTSQYVQPMPMFARAAAEVAAPVPVVAGELTVQATVSAVYEIR